MENIIQGVKDQQDWGTLPARSCTELVIPSRSPLLFLSLSRF